MAELSGSTFVFIGRSGCGKGTQAKLLEEYLKGLGLTVINVGTGAFARERAAEQTLMGRWIKSILDVGGFFPSWLADTLMLQMIEPHLLNGSEVLIIDGSPRRLSEAKVLDEFMAHIKRSSVRPIYLDISEDESRRRLLARGRGDDTPEVISNRLSWFSSEVIPVLNYYGDRLMRVPGEELPEEIHARIKASV
jgi:adenylate kinase